MSGGAVNHRWRKLLHSSADARSLMAFVLCAVVALPAGFSLVKPSMAERMIVHGGYYYILGVFALWIFYGCRLVAPYRARLIHLLLHPGRVGGFVIAATVFAIWGDTFAHKVL